jgi:sugar phosphate isomerase/epimerase
MERSSASSKKWKYAINTNSLANDLTYEQIAKVARNVNADGIEWGLASLADAPKAAKEMARVTQDHGLAVAGFINAGNLCKTDEMARWSEAVADAGGKTLRITPFWVAWDYNESLHQRESFPDMFRKNRQGLEKLIPLGKKFGIRYCLETHVGNVVPGADLARQLLDGLDSEVVGVIWDPANGIGEGHLRPRTAQEIIGPYLAYVHAKNRIWEKDPSDLENNGCNRTKWTLKTCRLDEGILDWVEVYYAMNVTGFTGWIALEEFFQPDPEPELRRGLEFLAKSAAAAAVAPREPFTTFNE